MGLCTESKANFKWLEISLECMLERIYKSTCTLPVVMSSEVRDHMRNGTMVVRGGEVRGRRGSRTAWTTQLQRWHFIRLEYTPTHAHTQSFVSLLSENADIDWAFVEVGFSEGVCHLGVYGWLDLFVQWAAGSWLPYALRGDGCKGFWEIFLILMVTGEQIESERFTWPSDT